MLLGTAGYESAITDLTTGVAPYGVAAFAMISAVLAITIGLKWVKRFASRAS